MTEQIVKWLSNFEYTLAGGETKAASELFHEESYWKDLVTFTWNIHTSEGRSDIAETLAATALGVKPRNFKIMGEGAALQEPEPHVEGWFTFETELGRSKGLVRLKDGKAWTLMTSLQELKGFEEENDEHGTRAQGAHHGSQAGRLSWLESKRLEESSLGHGPDKQPYVVIVGGGQGGIALGARLKQLKVPTIIVEKTDRAGDQWRNRYRSLCLHDPIWYDHLPYMPFPSNWPIFSPKDKIADWLECYVKLMELNYWSSTSVDSAHFDKGRGKWVVKVKNFKNEEVILRPTHLVMATGMSGFANLPTFAGQENFKGDIVHSSHSLNEPAWAGKKCVIIGANNSAHDICAALWEHGADVTMVQRSSTHIVRSEMLMKYGLGPLYSAEAVANGITTEKADLIFASMPFKIMHKWQIPVYAKIKELDADYYAALENVGFQHDWGDDESGLFMKYMRRGSGYYIDVGAVSLVTGGQIKLKSKKGIAIDHFLENSIVMNDGSELQADLVVCATGYGSMNQWAGALISQDVANKVGKCWGVGSNTTKDPGPWEGDLRNMWKPTHQDNFWFMGGNLSQSRHYSKYLALQLKARLEGLPTPVYKIPEVHHLA